MKKIIKSSFIESIEKENINHLSYFLSIILNSRKEEIIDLLKEISLNQKTKETFIKISKNWIIEVSNLENCFNDWNFIICQQYLLTAKKELSCDKIDSCLSEFIINELLKNDYISNKINLQRVRIFTFMTLYFLKNFSNENLNISNEQILSIFPYIPTKEEMTESFKKLGLI